jgi:uncharacterized protein
MDRLVVAKGPEFLGIEPGMANRHGLVAGATGTGKTVTLRVMAERFSEIGVPVFLADVKGDLASMAFAGADKPKLLERASKLGLSDYAGRSHPVVLWDVFGEKGHPVRATASEMGPVLLGRLLGLNETQTDVLTLIFKIADDQGLLLLDLKDLRSMLAYVGEHAKDFRSEYGNISAASAGAIQRKLVALGEAGGDVFFGEPALDLFDFMQRDRDGRGVVNILAADKLLLSPKIYSTFLLWLLSELFERLPEVGDPDKPRLVFFFDEAHLLFNDAPKALLEKIELVVRLVRSKGVGVYFVTQSPSDVPESVLGQLGNRVQHALRAFTPKDREAVRAAARTFRENPAFDAEAALTELGVGEALVSFLDAKGAPGIVERALVCPPESRLGTISESERRGIVEASAFYGHYEAEVDRESAYEKLAARVDVEAAETARAAEERANARPKGGSRREGLAEAMAKSAARAVGSRIGREIVRGLLGVIFGGRK